MTSITCDRESLVMHAEGVLLERNAAGYRVQDEVQVQRALAAMESGETVLLVDEGRIVSQARLEERDGEIVIVETEVER